MKVFKIFIGILLAFWTLFLIVNCIYLFGDAQGYLDTLRIAYNSYFETAHDYATFDVLVRNVLACITVIGLPFTLIIGRIYCIKKEAYEVKKGWRKPSKRAKKKQLKKMAKLTKEQKAQLKKQKMEAKVERKRKALERKLNKVSKEAKTAEQKEIKAKKQAESLAAFIARKEAAKKEVK